MESKDFNISVSLGEYHLIFGALVDKEVANKRKMEGMFIKESPDALFATKISDQAEYDRLQKENNEIMSLLKRIFKETGEQL